MFVGKLNRKLMCVSGCRHMCMQFLDTYSRSRLDSFDDTPCRDEIRYVLIAGSHNLINNVHILEYLPLIFHVNETSLEMKIYVKVYLFI